MDLSILIRCLRLLGIDYMDIVISGNRSLAPLHPVSVKSRDFADPKELEEIFVRTYGPIRRDRQGVGRVEPYPPGAQNRRPAPLV